MKMVIESPNVVPPAKPPTNVDIVHGRLGCSERDEMVNNASFFRRCVEHSSSVSQASKGSMHWIGLTVGQHAYSGCPHFSRLVGLLLLLIVVVLGMDTPSLLDLLFPSKYPS